MTIIEVISSLACTKYHLSTLCSRVLGVITTWALLETFSSHATTFSDNHRFAMFKMGLWDGPYFQHCCHLRWESTCRRWISLTKVLWCGTLMFPCYWPEYIAGDLGCLPTKTYTMFVPIFTKKGYFFNGRSEFAKLRKRVSVSLGLNVTMRIFFLIYFLGKRLEEPINPSTK